jgi:hypothetical protein
MGTVGSFPRGKERPERDAYHSPHLVPRTRMNRSYTFPLCRLHGGSGTALLYIFTEHQGLLPCSQDPANCPILSQMCPIHTVQNYFPTIYFIIALQYTLHFSSGLLLSGFRTEMLYTSSSPLRALHALPTSYTVI